MQRTAISVLKKKDGDVQAFHAHFFGEISLQLNTTIWEPNPEGVLTGSGGSCSQGYASDLLCRLLSFDPAARHSFGDSDCAAGSKGDAQLLMTHPFFDEIDWDALENRKVPPPYLPGAGDICYDINATAPPVSFNDILIANGRSDWVRGNATGMHTSNTSGTSVSFSELTDPQQVIFMEWSYNAGQHNIDV